MTEASGLVWDQPSFPNPCLLEAGFHRQLMGFSQACPCLRASCSPTETSCGRPAGSRTGDCSPSPTGLTVPAMMRARNPFVASHLGQRRCQVPEENSGWSRYLLFQLVPQKSILCARGNPVGSQGQQPGSAWGRGTRVGGNGQGGGGEPQPGPRLQPDKHRTCHPDGWQLGSRQAGHTEGASWDTGN